METSNGMKLLIITQKVNSADPILGFFVSWIKKFAGEFEEVIVMAKEVGGHQLLPDNVRVISLGKSEGVGWLGQLKKLLTVVMSKKYDCVFVHMNPEYVLAAGWWWKLKKIPVALWYTHKATPWQLRLAVPWVKWIFTASKESFRLPSKKVIITGHGIDASLFQKNENIDITKMLAVGRITPTKDYETIIRAVILLKEQGLPHTLDIIGGPILELDKSYNQALRELVVQSGFSGSIQFFDALPHYALIKKYNDYGVLLHASGTGSLDKVVLEAILAGLLPISSSEAFTNLDTSLRFEADNSRDLADKIIGLAKINTAVMQQKLTDWVLEKHNLNNLIKKISDRLVTA